MSAPGDSASVTVLVKVPPAEAFDVFTREIDLWWRQGPRFRIGARRPGALSFEPGVGGRLLETYDLPAGPRTFEQWTDYLGALEVTIGPDDEAMVDSLVAPGHPSTPGYNDPMYPLAGR